MWEAATLTCKVMTGVSVCGQNGQTKGSSDQVGQNDKGEKIMIAKDEVWGLPSLFMDFGGKET